MTEVPSQIIKRKTKKKKKQNKIVYKHRIEPEGLAGSVRARTKKNRCHFFVWHRSLIFEPHFVTHQQRIIQANGKTVFFYYLHGVSKISKIKENTESSNPNALFCSFAFFCDSYICRLFSMCKTQKKIRWLFDITYWILYHHIVNYYMLWKLSANKFSPNQRIV